MIPPHTPVRLTPQGYRQTITRFGIPGEIPLEEAKGFTLLPDNQRFPPVKGSSWVDWEGRKGRPILVPNHVLKQREPNGREEAIMGI